MKNKNRIRKLKKQAAAALSHGQLDRAREVLEKLCELDRYDIESWASLVTINAQLNRPDQVEYCCRSILSVLPGSDEAYYHLGCALMLQQKHHDAISAFRQVIRLNSSNIPAWLYLARMLHVLGDLDESISCYTRVVELEPGSAQAYSGMGRVLENKGEIEAAKAQYKKALEVNPDMLEACIGLAYVCVHMGEFGEAKQLASHALALDSNNEDAIALAANVADRTGCTEEALQLLEPLIESGSSHVNAALTFSGISRKRGREKEAIGLMESILARQQNMPSSNQCGLHFELGKCYDSIKAFGEAFAHFKEGHRLKHAEFDLDRHRERVAAVITNFSAEFMRHAPRASVRSSRPVFVVGMIRSGTTLVEQILASHPAVIGAGELPDIIRLASSLPAMLDSDKPYPECISLLTQDAADRLAQPYLDRLDTLAPGAMRVVDKMPGNFMHLGLIELLFPEAVIIHCVRHPFDTCLSAYFQDFSQSHAYSYDFHSLGRVYRQYLRIMEHWREVLSVPVLEIRYEELVASQEPVSRRLLEFCGLDWDERCLSFHKRTGAVATASYDQVTRALYAESVNRWKNYEDYIDPLKDALGDVIRE